MHLISNLMIGQQQPPRDDAFGMQGILHRAVKVSAEFYGAQRGCVPMVINYQALCDHPALLGVINSQHFIPSVALTNTVLALSLMIKERQDRQHGQGWPSSLARWRCVADARRWRCCCQQQRQQCSRHQQPAEQTGGG